MTMVSPAVVTIFCADVSHPTKRVSVETFARADVSTGWDLITKSTATGARKVLNGPVLTADQGLTAADANTLARRVRYTIRCSVCGLDVSARREIVSPLFDLITDHSTETDAAGIRVSRVPLPWLAAKLASSS